MSSWLSIEPIKSRIESLTNKKSQQNATYYLNSIVGPNHLLEVLENRFLLHSLQDSLHLGLFHFLTYFLLLDFN